MAQLTLTRDSIEADIQEYEQRILSALDRLKALPAAKFQTRKHKATRRVAGNQIDHITTMISYAKQALARLEKK